MIRRLTFGPLASESKEPRDASELRSCQLPSIGRPRRWRPRTLYLLPTGARVPPHPPTRIRQLFGAVDVQGRWLSFLLCGASARRRWNMDEAAPVSTAASVS